MSVLKRLLDKSPSYLWQWYPAKRHTQDLMASMDMAAFEKLKAFKNDSTHPHYKKYFNIEYWLRKNMQRVLFLRLNKTQKRLRILDLGSGFGYFPCAAGFFGHEVAGIDIPGDNLFDQSSKFLEVDRRHHAIESGTPLPSDLRQFDLITSFQVCFNNHYSDQPWGKDDWDWFIGHLLDAHVNTGGKIYLEMNYHHALQDWISDDARQMLKDKYGARFNGSSRILIQKG